MATFQFKHVHIESFAYCIPPKQISSSEIEEALSQQYEKLEIPTGTLEKITGIKTRYLYELQTKPSEGAKEAGIKALENLSFGKEKIGALINCSVTRDTFEPATACIVHSHLGLNQNAFAFDISNACVGFSNAMVAIASMIEAGAIDAGMIVSCEQVNPLIDHTLQHIQAKSDLTRKDFLQILPVFTLGSAAISMVLCHEKIASKSHRFLGSVMKTASEFHDLCVGNEDYAYHLLTEPGKQMLMNTQANQLIHNASKLSAQNLKEFSAAFDWKPEDIQHVIPHQVGKKGNGNEHFYRNWELETKKEFSVYQKFGNTASCALPKTFMIAAEQNRFKENEKILLAGYGSGLNTAFSGVIW